MKDPNPIRKTEAAEMSEEFNWVEEPLRQALAARPAHQSAVSLTSLAIARWRNGRLRLHADAVRLIRLRKLLGCITFLAAAMVGIIVWRTVASVAHLLQSASLRATSGTAASTAAATVQTSSGTAGTLAVLAAWTPTVAALLVLAGVLLVLRRLFSAETFNMARPAAWF